MAEDETTSPSDKAEKPAADAAEPKAKAAPEGESSAAPAGKESSAPAASEKAAADTKADDKPAKKVPKKTAPKAASKEAAAEGDVSRRGFFSWAAVAWVGFTAAIGGCVTAWGRFMFPNVLYEPPTSFKVGLPDQFPEGVVDERFKESNGVWIVNENGRLYSLIAICTHLGCPPAWLEAQNKFKCPCHGSGYYKNGINFEGPTPRPLERARIFVDPGDGQVVVDKSQKFQWELGQWDDPNSFVDFS